MERPTAGISSLKGNELLISFVNEVVRVSSLDGEVSLPGTKVRVKCRLMEPDLVRAEVNGSVCDVIVRPRDSNEGHAKVLDCRINGKRVVVSIDDKKSHLRAQLLSGRQLAGVTQRVRAPMPGLVTKIEVTEGDHVKAGKGLIILEAMKMENEIRATAAGVVGRINATLGKPVEKAELLMEIHPTV